MTGRGNPSSDRQVSDLPPPMTANVSAPDHTAGEWCTCAETNATGATSPEYRCPSCATPDADDASEALTEAERASIYATVRGYDEDQHPGPIYAAVERIKAAAATKARAEGAAIGFRAALDPGSFVKRGAAELAGEPFTERMDQWQRRAMDEGLARIARGEA